MKIVTSLSFPGNCREAFDFYAGVLGGEITAAIPYGEGFPGMPMPPADQGLADALLAAGRGSGDHGLGHAPRLRARTCTKPKDGFDVTLHFDKVEEARRVFDALSEGGEVRMPFAESPWSPGFGGFTDKFGVPWMINTTPAA